MRINNQVMNRDLSLLTKKTNKPKGDISIYIITFALAAFGVLAVYSASGYVAKRNMAIRGFLLKSS